MLLVPTHDDSVPLIVQSTTAPVVVGVGDGGTDTVCPACRRHVLIKNMPPDSVFDLALKCCGCGAISRVPRFPPGRGLGAIAVVVPPGRHVAEGSLIADCDQVVIGEPGARRRGTETGTRGPGGPPTRVEMSPTGIEELLREAREVLPIIDTLMPRQRRQPAHPHRLPELVANLEANLAALDGGPGEVDVISFIELTRAVSAFARWAADPNQDRLLQESKDPGTFSHNVLLLELASTFADAEPAPGLGPEFIPGGRGRTPDLRLRISARRALELELKTPRALQRRPSVAVPPKEAGELIEKAVHESRTQFSPHAPAVLAIGGAFWTDDFEDHARATAEILRRRGRKRLVAVVLASTTIELAHMRGSGPFEGRWDEVDWRADSQFRWVPNPAYAGDLKVSFAPDLSDFSISFFAGHLPGKLEPPL